MTPSARTTHQRDRRFARVRLLTRSVFVGSSALSIGMVGYLASVTTLHKKVITPPTTTTTTPVTTPSTGVTGATGVPVTTTTVAPVTTTTVCTTSPSGNTTCY
jgi:hypothetical protein